MPFRTPTNVNFAKYFRGWNRLEGRSRRDDFSIGLQKATADALWMLGRQWQASELTGEDAATQIHVEATIESVTLDQIVLGSGTPENVGTVPVEVLVEREQVDWDWRMRIRAGQHFERLARLNQPNAEGLLAQLRVTLCPVQ
ncbi:MAG: hypothetical protein LAO78_13330 [Acidobacteriia bacterium]|nr:hypothetical protein [Terriglobia bacterium]